jgi:hypothetical protein
MSEKVNSAPVAEKRGEKPSSQSQPVAGPALQQPAGPAWATAGNQAMQRLLQQGVIQARLEVSQAGDPAEQEAEAAARAFQDGKPSRLSPATSRDIFRVSAPWSESPSKSPPVRPVQDQSGQPLPDATRARMESHFGQDFSEVRVHTDSKASASAESLAARAYTFGSQIVFRNGLYVPESTAGQRLLAHELAHVVQQRGARWRILRQTEGAQTGAPAQGGGSPVMWGLDMSVRPQTIYLSVSFPGHSLAEVATYLYGSADAVDSLRAANAGLTDHLSAGQTLRPAPNRPMNQTALDALNTGIDQGTVLRSRGMPTDASSATLPVYPVNIGGATQLMTAGQVAALVRGVLIWMARKAEHYRDMLDIGLEVRNDHEQNTNSVVRGISDWMGDVNLPSTSLWTRPWLMASEIIPSLLGVQLPQGEGFGGVLERARERGRANALGQVEIAQRILDNPISPETGRIISENLTRLQTVALALGEADYQWHTYIEGTISGAGRTVHYLELTRNISFGVAAGLAGAVAAPAAFAFLGAGGLGLSTGSATVLSLGAAAGSGGLLRGSLEVVAPGAQADVGAGTRFLQGFGSGSVQGLLGGAGSFATPAVSGLVGQGVSRIAGQQFLTTTAGRYTVNAITSGLIGSGSGGAGAALENAPALISGRMSGGQYFSQMGSGMGWGGALGVGFSFVPITGLSREGGALFHGDVAPPPRWLMAGPYSPLQANWEPPPGFNALGASELPQLPPGLTWGRVTQGGRPQWEPISMFGPNRQPLDLLWFGDPVNPRGNYVLQSQVGTGSGTIFGRQTFRPANDLYSGLGANQGAGGTPLPGAPASTRSSFPITNADFIDPATGVRYTRGHIIDFANTTDRTAAIPDSNMSPQNFSPEQGWWGGLSGRNRLTIRIRSSSPAGGAQLVQYNVFSPTPRTTANGTPIPDAFILVELDPAGAPARAWRVPNNTNAPPSPVNTAAAIDAGYGLALGLIPQPVMNDLAALARFTALAGVAPALGTSQNQSF